MKRHDIENYARNKTRVGNEQTLVHNKQADKKGKEK